MSIGWCEVLDDRAGGDGEASVDAAARISDVKMDHRAGKTGNDPEFMQPGAARLYLEGITFAAFAALWCNVRMDHLTDVLTAISHPTRRAIIGQLANGPARFLDVAKPFDTALNAVTKHLKLLQRAGLIERRKQGREVFISFRGDPLREVAEWMNEYERFWNERLDQFERYFKDKKEKTEKGK